PRDLLAAEDDTATLRTQEADDRLERGGLPGAVRADHGHDLPNPDAQRDAVQDVDRAVASDELVGGEELRAHTAARVRHGLSARTRGASAGRTRGSPRTRHGARRASRSATAGARARGPR